MTSYVILENHEFQALLAECTTQDEAQEHRNALQQEEIAIANNFKNTLDPQASDIQARLDENTDAIATLQKYQHQAFIRWLELAQT